MEEPGPANQYQRPVGAFPTSTGEPVTLEPGPNAPTTEAPGGTYDARNEAAVGTTQEPRTSPTAKLGANDGARREPPLHTTRISDRTSVRTPLGTTPTALPAAPLAIATQEPRAYDYYARPNKTGGGRGSTGHPIGHG